MPVHKKPLDQTPSLKLLEFINLDKIPVGPVVDLACGYGRNGAFFVQKKYNVIFTDISMDCLDFILAGKNVAYNGDIDTSLIQTKVMDLSKEWLFERESVAGFILVDYYNPLLLEKIDVTLKENGFIYIETIKAHKGNVENLPEYKTIINFFDSHKYKIVYYKERPSNYNDKKVSSVTLFAYK